MTLSCFKAYDIRGQLGEELNNELAYRIGRAYGEWLQSPAVSSLSTHQTRGIKTVVVGGDIRLSSASLKQALAEGLLDAGIHVIDLGMTGTEEVYFATFHLGVEGGIEVTASHNPMDYNGMKLVREGSKPISGDSGLFAIRRLAEANQFQPMTQRGTLTHQSCLADYVQHLLSYIDPAQLKPLKLVVNAGNGAAGPVIDALEAEFQRLQVPISFIKVHHQPDGSFPHGIPNPLLPECRADTRDAVLAHQADLGIAWDGDFDRCFLFDENGNFIEGYYIVGLLAAAFLQKQAGAKIIHDPRLTWNTVDIVKTNGGIPIQSKTGHAFIKERMRSEDAIYGGEMSAHHYFRDFAYCDSGMIPWLLVTELLCKTGKPLSALVSERMAAYPCSGEINFRVQDVQASIARVETFFSASVPPIPNPSPARGEGSKSESPVIDRTDGLSMAFADWRFNLRGSNTEPVLRLNVESRGDLALMQAKTQEISQLLHHS
ncbi:phosphomannomutase [Thiothrix eikelboomii]|uniref:phosphomannomutase n=1 Tax=Thiothrix eikelboomii TaxID=92487 RepID=A0A1T4XJ81_9GAMM|nr:phosphomannomutase [Thiothrix eikelboomii]SKA89577.1 phosphomannomutase [Thiothrix eikelboomii]